MRSSRPHISISGAAGKRDWNRVRSLFIPGARLIPAAESVTSDEGRATSSGEISPQILDVEGFITRAERFFRTSGFYETEIARRIEQFGSIAHAWSTYESRHNAGDLEPFMRGINSIQLFNDGSRWWIVTIWQHESPENPVPEKYLQGTRLRVVDSLPWQSSPG